MDHNWTHIEDYESHDSLANKELRALASVWHEQRERLTEEEAYYRFEQKLKREWAIETGLIERLYTFDRGITELLIEEGIHDRPPIVVPPTVLVQPPPEAWGEGR